MLYRCASMWKRPAFLPWLGPVFSSEVRCFICRGELGVGYPKGARPQDLNGKSDVLRCGEGAMLVGFFALAEMIRKKGWLPFPTMFVPDVRKALVRRMPGDEPLRGPTPRDPRRLNRGAPANPWRRVMGALLSGTKKTVPPRNAPFDTSCGRSMPGQPDRAVCLARSDCTGVRQCGKDRPSCRGLGQIFLGKYAVLSAVGSLGSVTRRVPVPGILMGRAMC